MGDWVDFAKVKSSVSIVDILSRYGVGELKRKGDELVGVCPFGCGHSKTNKRVFSANTSKNNFQCFSCGVRGNVIDFVKLKESCSVRDAALLLAEWFEVENDNGNKEPNRGVAINLVSNSQNDNAKEKLGNNVVENLSFNPLLSFALRVDDSHSYGTSRGLAQETILEFGCGLCLSRGMFAGRYVIPLYNERRELVGYAGRSLDEKEPRYLYPPSDKGFYKRYLLFNLHRVLRDFSSSSFVVVVEGIFSTMLIHQLGFPCVSLLGSSLSDEQAGLLKKYFTGVVLLLDSDKAGDKGTSDALQKLVQNVFVKIVRLDEGKQPDTIPVETLKTILNKALAV